MSINDLTDRDLADQLRQRAKLLDTATHLAAVEVLIGYNAGQILASRDTRSFMGMRTQPDGVGVRWYDLGTAATAAALHDLPRAANDAVRLACSLTVDTQINLRDCFYRWANAGTLPGIMRALDIAAGRPIASDAFQVGDWVHANGWGDLRFQVKDLGPYYGQFQGSLRIATLGDTIAGYASPADLRRVGDPGE